MAKNDNHSEISAFFNSKSVFITGATGFVGKQIIEKLLRSCPG
jgi:fatty acyl-CoA reductase